MNGNGLPGDQGLYRSANEKDSCGVGIVCRLDKLESNQVLKDGLGILKRLRHRGAVGADETSGDGAGIMTAIPDMYFKKVFKETNINLPKSGHYGVGMSFLPQNSITRLFIEGIIEDEVKKYGCFIAFRDVPISDSGCGISLRHEIPVIKQFFLSSHDGSMIDEKDMYLVRRKIEKRVKAYDSEAMFYICSLSSKTIIYKGQIIGSRLEEFYLDLRDHDYKTNFAMVHERYSTNTFPSWNLAQPFRVIAHNGEINTIKGNMNWMNAREGVIKSNVFGDNINDLLPIIDSKGSDSAILDNVVEAYYMNNDDLPYTLKFIIPEAYEKKETLGDQIKGFYEYHSRYMEPWDGPATIGFCDGRIIGAATDRNGLRPVRYMVTNDNRFILASEIGVIDIDSSNVSHKGSISPGEMIKIDLETGELVGNSVILVSVIGDKDYRGFLDKNQILLEEKTVGEPKLQKSRLEELNRVFNYTKEEIDLVIKKMCINGTEPVGSMGCDIPLAFLSDENQCFFNYFKQKFAQVTNPPIDPLREKGIMAMTQYISHNGSYMDKVELDLDKKFIKLNSPILLKEDLDMVEGLSEFRTQRIPIVFEPEKENGLKEALELLCKRAEETALQGNCIIVLSDKTADRYLAPIPSLLALSAIHEHLLKKKLRTQVDIIIESGECKDSMHYALLLGYGAKAVCPYLVVENISYIYKDNELVDEKVKNYKKAIEGALMKIMSRMGISSLQSYVGAQMFEAVGLSKDILSVYFPNTSGILSGVGVKELQSSITTGHIMAYEDAAKLKTGGVYKLTKEGERHIIDVKRATLLSQCAKENSREKFKVFSQKMDKRTKPLKLRDMMELRIADKPLPLSEVEDVSQIIKRFVVEGMSLGSISGVAHEDISLAMNSLGARSNSGEGGEDNIRAKKTINGISLSSSIKQIASGRFGVDIEYIASANELQIKVAQGAKPGEGGHLPAHKATTLISNLRHAMPNSDIISPPPHHDIYSIEDLAQLIYDLKSANPKAAISIKLVSSGGIGTVAAGVVKAHGNIILISGHDGGTGASSLSSMRYTGLPWEIGLSEVQQTLMLNDLRGRVKLRVDGKMFTAKDVITASCLGADEFGFGSAALIALGCIQCRQCHLNMCPVGIATQEEALVKKYKGDSSHIVNYFTILAEEVRELLAEIGVSSIDELIGRTDYIHLPNSKDFNSSIDLSDVVYKPLLPERIKSKFDSFHESYCDNSIDKMVIEGYGSKIESGEYITLDLSVSNTDRAVGTMISGYFSNSLQRYYEKDPVITLNLVGYSGQSLGAFLSKGIDINLLGDSNDYVGKGLSGGRIYIKGNGAKEASIGNGCLYGATAGNLYVDGDCGHRFAVRNSGATAIAIDIGNHGCEYMTRGTVVILGKAGLNLCSGMTGGRVFIFDEEDLVKKLNCQYVEVYSCSDEELEQAYDLIKDHSQKTGSIKSKSIIEKWEEYSKRLLVIKK